MPQPQPQPVPQPVPEPIPEPFPEPQPKPMPIIEEGVVKKRSLFPSKRQQKREERERKKREFAGAFAYRAGVVVHAFKEPYQSQSDVATFHINNLPPDINILPDQKTAIETIQQIRPGAPIDLVIDQGFQDVHVKTTQAGNLMIGFEYDKGNSSQQQITVKKHDKPKPLKIEPIEIRSGSVKDMGTNEDIQTTKQNVSDVLDQLGVPDEKIASEQPVPESAWGDEQSGVPRPIVREAVIPPVVRPRPQVGGERQPSGFEVSF